MDHPLPWLQYVDAGVLDDERVDFDGLNVESPTGEHLGEVEGFIVDAESGRPYYVVVDAGGWFKSKDYLLPIGQARLDLDREVLVTDLTRDRIDRFPGFDKDEFATLSTEALRQFNDQTSMAVSDAVGTYSTTEPFTAAWNRPEFRHPDWWRSPSPLGRAAARTGDTVRTPPVTDTPRSWDRASDIRAAEGEVAAVGRADADRNAPAQPRAIDPSPHFDGRAQPGDVLGLETGGESTHIGETAEDENSRRQQAERNAADRRE